MSFLVSKLVNITSFSNHTHWRTAPVEFSDDDLAEYEKQRKALVEVNKKEEKAKKKKKFY